MSMDVQRLSVAVIPKLALNEVKGLARNLVVKALISVH